MKKIVSLLVAIAMVLGLSITAFATTTSDSFLAANGVNYDWTAPVSGEATFSTSSGSGMIAVNEGNVAMGTGSVTFTCVEGTTYQIKHFVAGGDLISWSVEVNGGADADATSGTVVIESYGSGDFTAPKDGTIKLTMDYADAEMDIVIGWSYIGTIANGETINVTAGTTYSVYPLGVPVDATLTWEYVEGGDAGDAGDESNAIPSGEALALGDNDVELTYAMMAMQAPYWTYTATENGFLTVTVASIAGNSNLGMAFGRGMCTLLVGETDGAYTNTVTVDMMAGETVNIAVLYTVDMNPAPAILNLAFEGAGAAEPIPSGGELALGYNDVEITWAMMAMQAPYWTYTAAEGGFLTVAVDSINGNSELGMAFGRGMYTLVVGNADGMGSNMVTVYVAAGETVNVAVLDTVDEMGVMIPAVLNVSFIAGEPVIEETPGDYYEQDAEGNYIIPSLLEYDSYIFSGNNDIYFVYVAEAAGVVSVYPTVDGYSATNCWFTVNGANTYSGDPVEVAAGDVVIINVWDGFEGFASFVAGAGDDNEDSAISGSESVDAGVAIEFLYTPDADGILTIALSADPGYKIWVFNNATDETIGLPKSGTSGSYEYALEAGVEYRIQIIGYYDWEEVAATISYEGTFKAAELEVEQIEIDESTVELVVGEQNIELLPNTITTLFNFYAPEAGIYTLTVPAGAEAALYGFTWTPYQVAEGNTLVFTATAEGQGFMVGLSNAEASFNVTLEKTGEYQAPKETTYVNYVPTVKFDGDVKLPEGDVTSVDITAAQTVVLGTDGYYHLGTANGPILYVNLNSDGFTLATLLDAGAPITMRGEKYQDENGDLFCNDYMNMIAYGDYYSYSKECDYYPLNADLMKFFQDYGAAQGWYNANFSNFEAIKSGDFNEESAWMVALVYFADNSGNVGGGDDNAQTGDFGIIAASVAMGLSAICGTAMLTKKKEF